MRMSDETIARYNGISDWLSKTCWRTVKHRNPDTDEIKARRKEVS